MSHINNFNESSINSLFITQEHVQSGVGQNAFQIFFLKKLLHV